jgi:hypothetical protein
MLSAFVFLSPVTKAVHVWTSQKNVHNLKKSVNMNGQVELAILQEVNL